MFSDIEYCSAPSIYFGRTVCMTRRSQGSLPGLEEFRRNEHGGTIRRGERKLYRPLAVKRPMHFSFKSTLAKGRWSFLSKENARFLQRLLSELSHTCSVRILKMANSGNHCHLVVQG